MSSESKSSETAQEPLGGDPRSSVAQPIWCVILYLDARDGDRSLIGPFTHLGLAYEAKRALEGYGDAEIRRVESLDRTLSAIEALTPA